MSFKQKTQPVITVIPKLILNSYFKCFQTEKEEAKKKKNRGRQADEKGRERRKRREEVRKEGRKLKNKIWSETFLPL